MPANFNLMQFITLALACFIFIACENAGEQTYASASADQANGGSLLVAVSNYPMKYFTERIGGDEVQVVFLAPADEDPAFWNPTPGDVQQMQAADLIILNGADYEKWASTVTLPESKIVATSAGFEDQWLSLPTTVTHSHGPGGEHSHAGTDFNTWLDPMLAIQQAEAIQAALAEARPAASETFQQNAAELTAELQVLHTRLENVFANYGDAPLVASHPVYGYFARRYNLNLEALLWEPEAMPSDREWAKLESILEEHPATIMLWEGEPDPAIEAQLNEHGVTGVVVAPAGNTPGEGDYLDVWNANVERLASAEPATP